MLIVYEHQFNSFKTHYTNDFKNDAAKAIKTHTSKRSNTCTDDELACYINVALDFCERYRISNKNHVLRLMLLNMELDFMESLPFGCDRLLSDLGFSQTYRVNSLLELLTSSPQRTCVSSDDIKEI